ncbi:MAG: hypothetical protein ACFCUV_16855 [Rivularia sp. (in: cyanobacteria)]
MLYTVAINRVAKKENSFGKSLSLNPELNFSTTTQLVSLKATVVNLGCAESFSCFVYPASTLFVTGLRLQVTSMLVKVMYGSNWVPTNHHSRLASRQGYNLRRILTYQGRRYLIGVARKTVVFVPSFKKE